MVIPETGALAPRLREIILVGMFTLTRREQIVMILILLALVTGAGIRHFRTIGPFPWCDTGTARYGSNTPLGIVTLAASSDSLKNW
jgi:hypothetical protein